MYIERNNLTPGMRAEVYPFATEQSETLWQGSISVMSDGRLIWRGREWTKQQLSDYLAALSAGIAEALRIAEESCVLASPAIVTESPTNQS